MPQCMQLTNRALLHRALWPGIGAGPSCSAVLQRQLGLEVACFGHVRTMRGMRSGLPDLHWGQEHLRQRGPAALHDALHLARVLPPAHADVARVRQAADGLHEGLPQCQHDGEMLSTTTFSPVSDTL